MSESRPNKKKIEFIESYWTGDEFGSDYQWNDNHGELIRCQHCANGKQVTKISINGSMEDTVMCQLTHDIRTPDWYCADGKKRD